VKPSWKLDEVEELLLVCVEYDKPGSFKAGEVVSVTVEVAGTKAVAQSESLV
jgi:hypothetical protein